MYPASRAALAVTNQYTHTVKICHVYTTCPLNSKVMLITFFMMGVDYE